MKEPRVAIAGATGMVGQEFMRILEQRDFPVASLRLLASERSRGRSFDFRGETLPVEVLDEKSFDGIDIALFSAGGSISKKYAPIAAGAGAVVVDNSSAWRMDPEVPLVVPEVNPGDTFKHKGIIANPNCSTIQMVVALYPLHKVNSIKRIIVDTYQSVSGTGKEAVDELKSQVAEISNGSESVTPKIYPYQIAFNLFPHIDVWMPDGSCREEWKMIQETKKIMHLPGVRMVATTARVPVYAAHSEAVHIELEHPMTAEEAREILRSAPGVVVQDDVANNIYPMPLPAAGRDEVFVGRIRKNEVWDNGLSLWVVSDNIRKGAATNTVQIAQLLVQKGLLGNKKAAQAGSAVGQG